MGGATEMLEKMEHAGHAGHGGHGDDHGGGHGPGKMIGITMAILGVLLAFCAAMVGSARTEFIAAMVEQTDAGDEYQAVLVKHRIAMSQLRLLHAITPSQEEIHAFEKQLGGIHSRSGKEDTEDTAELKQAIELSTKELASIITPDPEDELDFVELVREYDEEAEVTKKWTDSYDEIVHAHFEASEHYEWAQLASEVGIVIASIALLLSSRAVWLGSVILGLACFGIIGWTYASTKTHLEHGEHAVEEAKKEVEKHKSSKSVAEREAAFVKEVEAKAKAAIAARGGGHGGEGHGGGDAPSHAPEPPKAPAASGSAGSAPAPAHPHH
jgi:hypothetical protein